MAPKGGDAFQTGNGDKPGLSIRFWRWLRSQRLQDILTGYAFIAPAFLSLGVWWLFPMVYSVYLSLTEWDFLRPVKKFVGIANYLKMFSHAEFARVLWNTTYFSVATTVFSLLGGLVLALILYQKIRGTSFYRALIFSPWVTPTVAAALVWLWIYNRDMGILNNVLSLFGVPRIDWIGSGRGALRLWAMPSLIIFTIWKTLGYNMVYFMAGLTTIPSELYEAAEIDGADTWDKLRHITLPLLSPITFFLLVISLITTFNAFDQIRVMTRGGPGDATRTMVYYMYQNGFESFKVGYGSAVAVVIFLILFVLTIVQFRLARKWVHYA